MSRHSFLTMIRSLPPVTICWWLVVLTFPFLTGFGPPRVVDHVFTPTQRIQVGEEPAWQRLHKSPDVSAAAYLFYDVDANRVVFAENADIALPIASLTKLMTALLVLEAGNLDTEVIVQREDIIGGASMLLVPGEVITVEQLLWGLLIPSGNDAAMTLARHVAGSVDAFVERMNRRASALGLQQTTFVNPHGLDEDGHLSSAVDLLVLAKETWDYPLFRQIVRTAQTTVNGHPLTSTNEWLDLYPGTNGIKTGTTDNAGQCLIVGIQRDGRQIIGIVLGSNDRYRDMQILHQRYLENYQWVEGDWRSLSILNRLQAADGTLWYLRPEGGAPVAFLATVERHKLRPYRKIERPLDQPWQVGMRVGVVEWYAGKVVVASQPLLLW